LSSNVSLGKVMVYEQALKVDGVEKNLI